MAAASKGSSSATKAGTGKASSLILDFDMERETKGTQRYKEAAPANGVRPAIGTLYVTKAALVSLTGNVKRLRVTIEAIG